MCMNTYTWVQLLKEIRGAGDNEDTAYKEMVPETKQLVLRQHRSKRPE